MMINHADTSEKDLKVSTYLPYYITALLIHIGLHVCPPKIINIVHLTWNVISCMCHTAWDCYIAQKYIYVCEHGSPAWVLK